MRCKVQFEPSKKVIERKQVVCPELDEQQGTTYTRVSYKDVDVSSDEYVKDIPTYKEYTLSNLLAAGVPLEQLNPVGLLSGNLSTTLDRLEQGKSVINKELETSKSE